MTARRAPTAMPSTTTVSLLLLVSALPACEDKQASGAPIPIGQLTGELADVYCRRVPQCCSAEEIAGLTPTFRQAMAAGSCATNQPLIDYLDDEFNLERVKASVAAGLAVYDPALGRACLDALAAAPCATWNAVVAGAESPQPASCRKMLRGTRAIGAICDLNREFECDSRSCGSDGIAAATCRPAPVAGERCPGRCEDVFDCASRCAGDLVCGFDDDRCAAAAPVPTVASFCGY